MPRVPILLAFSSQLAGRSTVYEAMTYVRNPEETEEKIVERRLIRVDCPMAQAGIAAALRRAFRTPPATDFDGQSLELLLKRLN